jgi:hypothetical protein
LIYSFQQIDGADDLLHAEGMHLNNLKRSIESQLQSAQRQLQALSSARRRLSAVLQERTRVQDLICAAIPSTSAPTSRSAFTGGRSSRIGYSLEREKTDFLNNAPPTDPLGPHTPEVEAALLEAKDVRGTAAALRQDINGLIAKAGKTQKSAHKAVNYGLTSKIAETAGLKVCANVYPLHLRRHYGWALEVVILLRATGRGQLLSSGEPIE